MGSLLPEVELCGDEGVVDDVEDVGVVGLEEGDDLVELGIVKEKAEMLRPGYKGLKVTFLG